MHRNSCNIAAIIQGTPDAVAEVHGRVKYPHICGSVKFYQTEQGVLIYADINGLPQAENNCTERVFGFHIHEGERCCGNSNDPFADTGMHYDSDHRKHPYHSGDMPPLFGNDGHAMLIFLTDRFSLSEVIGRTVVIHDKPDDFTTQPAGNAGTKIACGVIRRNDRR